jgi:hypothetical protein
MRELPILFSAPMVRAILEGRKTVTRRVVKPQPSEGFKYVHPTEFEPGVTCWTGFKPTPRMLVGTWTERKEPYRVGVRLYVRETALRELHPAETGLTREDLPHTWDMACEGAGHVHYAADLTENEAIIVASGRRWTPSIHMPKAWARIWLEVTAVRVERLQDISYEQAIAEGAIDAAPSVDHFQPGEEETGEETARRLRWPQRDFALLWDGLAKPGTRWADNPWVWVVEFKRVEVPRA